MNVRLWELGEYFGPEGQLPTLIDPDWIQGHLALTMVTLGRDRTKVWATVDLEKVRISVTGGVHYSDKYYTVINHTLS